MKSRSEMSRFADQVARKQGWSLNSDAAFLSDLLEGLAINEDRYGFFLCPCRDSWGDRERDKDIKCPCSYASADIEEHNRCYCGLFIHKGKPEKDLSPYVPDRRPDDLYPD